MPGEKPASGGGLCSSSGEVPRHARQYAAAFAGNGWSSWSPATFTGCPSTMKYQGYDFDMP
jgi:hypothetical protein